MVFCCKAFGIFNQITWNSNCQVNFLHSVAPAMIIISFWIAVKWHFKAKSASTLLQVPALFALARCN
jgi:hypothetical protein